MSDQEGFFRGSDGRLYPIKLLDPVSDSPIEVAVGVLFGAAATLIAMVWGAAQASARLFGEGAPAVTISDAAIATARFGANRFSWTGTWSAEAEASLVGPFWFWFIFGLEALALSIAFWPLWRVFGPRAEDPPTVRVVNAPSNHPRDARRKAARQAADDERKQRRSLAAVAGAVGGVAAIDPPANMPADDKVRASAPGAQRIVIGRSGNGLVANERFHSILAIGPTQSGKTSGLALPAVLEWDGPAVVVSAKPDLIARAWTERSELGGETWLFDPSASMAQGPGLPRVAAGGHTWSPLQLIDAVPRPRNEPEVDRRLQQWGLARRTAQWMVDGARRNGERRGAVPDGWFGVAEQMLGPLLLAAASDERPMAQVASWIHERDRTTVTELVERTGLPEAASVWLGTQNADAATVNGSYQLLSSLIYPFADPLAQPQARRSDVSTQSLFDGTSHTLFVLAPAHQQARLGGLFSTLVSEVLALAMTEATHAPSGRLDSPLLVLFDDTAGVAPPELLEQVAATGAGLGIQLMTLIHDLHHLGSGSAVPPSARDVANNHRARVIFGGITDVDTLEYLNSTIRGSRVSDGDRRGADDADLVAQAPSWLRTLDDGEVLFVYGNLAPMRVTLRPWYADAALRQRLSPNVQPEKRRRWFRLRPQQDPLVGGGSPNPLDSEANDREADRYWASIRDTGTLPAKAPYDDGS
ncbi:MAG: type IV secretory system conjugative DNA transfer family protein [Actinomycetota bacterium]